MMGIMAAGSEPETSKDFSPAHDLFGLLLVVRAG